MKKLLNNPRVVAVLAVIAVGFVVWSLREQMGGAKPRARSAVVAETVPDATEEGEMAASDGADQGVLSIPAILAALVLPANLPDPFIRRGATLVAGDPVIEPVAVAPDHVESVQLTAVWNQGAQVYAVINGRIMRPGEIVGRITVDTVATDGVWVTHWKGRDFVPFGGQFTLTTPAAGPPVRSEFLNEN